MVSELSVDFEGFREPKKGLYMRSGSLTGVLVSKIELERELLLVVVVYRKEKEQRTKTL